MNALTACRLASPSCVKYAAPSKIQMKYNPGDNLHMNDAGYQAMAAAIDLSLFKK